MTIVEQYNIPVIPPAEWALTPQGGNTVVSWGNLQSPVYSQTSGYQMTPGGDATFRNLTASGKLTVTAGGVVGGFDIGSNFLRDTGNTFGLYSWVTAWDDIRLWAGASLANIATAPFRVTEAGVLTATSGTIGGWTLWATTLTGGDLVLDAGNQRIQSSNYNAGSAGFRISSSLIEAENLIARGTMRGTTFAYDVVSAIGGQLMVANADTLASDMTANDSSTLTVKWDTTFAVNDMLIIRGVATSGIQEEYLRVTNIGSAPTYTVTRDLAGSFSSNSNPAWKSGTPVVKQGSWSSTTGNAYKAPVLTGNNTPSSLSVFQALTIWSNDAKIKLNVNWTSYDNLSVWIGSTDAVIASMSQARDYDPRVDGNYQVMQSFKTTTRNYIKTATFYLGARVWTFTAYAKIYAVDGSWNPTWAAITTVNLPSSDISSSYNVAYDITFNTLLNKNTSYAIVFSNPSGDGSNTFYVSAATGDYSDWELKDSTDGGSTWNAGVKDARFSIIATSSPTSYNEIASALQTTIQTATSQLETVAYSTDHFVVTGVADDYSITISSPSTGTDVSGAGATKYLDLANGSMVEGGYGVGGWLRLFGEGTNSPYYSVFKRLSGKYNDYVEVCRLGNLNWFLGYSADEYGIAIGDTNNNLTYDPTNSLRIHGGTFFDVVSSANIRTSSDASVAITYNSTTYTKKKEILYNDVAGTIRVDFSIEGDTSNNKQALGRVYINGSAVGTEQATVTGTAYSENFTVAMGDLIQIYAKMAASAFNDGHVYNFRLLYDKQVKPETNTVNI